jgi:hypothetical protein
MSGVKQATLDYERYMAANLPVVEADLTLKHQQMSKALFPFLRSTFYRWAALFPVVCPELTAAPPLLAVGDLHVENFGTWRDSEGRLIWGVNDVDEAAEMPYAVDLVRLATSALLAADEHKLTLAAEDVAGAILSGYDEWLQRGGEPYVLEEEHGWLRQLATGALRDPVAFWAKIGQLPEAVPPTQIKSLLAANLPSGAIPRRFASRVAGLGSLGRPRYILLADYGGGAVTREAKAMLPSAWNWATGHSTAMLRCAESLKGAVRCADPWLSFTPAAAQAPGWVVRRLAPHCTRVELTDLPAVKDDLRLLKAMGRETANLHLGSPARTQAVRQDLAARKPHWQAQAAVAMAAATRADWQAWRA